MVNITAILVSVAAFAEPSQVADISSSSDLRVCVSITDASSRLACLDRAARSIIDHADKDSVPASKKHALAFGQRRVPDVQVNTAAPLKPAMRSLESALVDTVTGPNGQWILTLQDGSRWLTQERGFLPSKAGRLVTIRRGALGSYRAIVRGQPPVQVRRIN